MGGREPIVCGVEACGGEVEGISVRKGKGRERQGTQDKTHIITPASASEMMMLMTEGCGRSKKTEEVGSQRAAVFLVWVVEYKSKHR